MRIYNWKPDLPDLRDYTYARNVFRAYPNQLDLASKCSPVVDQGNIGSCTANALSGAIEFLELKQLAEGKQGSEVFGLTFTRASRLFVYYNERVIENTVSQDSGAQLRDGIKSLANLGVCSENTWTYSGINVFQQPSGNCYIEASKHKITSYIRLDSTLTDLKDCIASGYPFVFGFTVYPYMESAEMSIKGILHMPGPFEKPLGGHAVMAVGYNDTTKMFKIRNSWGSNWGCNGYFYMPYEYITNQNLCDDFWVIKT